MHRGLATRWFLGHPLEMRHMKGRGTRQSATFQAHTAGEPYAALALPPAQ